MKSVLLVLLVALFLATTGLAAQEEFDYTALLKEIDAALDAGTDSPAATSFLELEATGPLDGVAGYVPEESPYTNPGTITTPTPTLPQTPTCTVRGQTIFEIRKMRADAKQIGMAIMYEIQIMEKRKAYIEEMTSYLNDRIRELNKVKQDLQAEQKWIQVSNARISELAQKEKLIKLQDVMSCIQAEQQRLTGESGSKNVVLSTLKTQSDAVNAQITAIRSSISQAIGGAGTTSGASGASGVAPPK